MTIQEALNQALTDHRNGLLREAEVLYRQVLAVAPDHPDALHLLGVIASQAGRHDLAADLILRAIHRNPTAAEYHANLGLALAAMNQFSQAIAAYQQAIALRPDFPDALNNLGKAHDLSGQTAQAVECYRRAIALKPDFASAHSNLAQALCMAGETDAAIAALQQTIALAPQSAQAYNNLGNAFYRKGDPVAAEQACRNALILRPDLPDAHLNLAVALLMQGKLPEGFKEYAWRSRVQGTMVPRRSFMQPRWDGSELLGRRILLHVEQGFGDMIQFIRYVPMVVQRGGKVIVDCPEQFIRLLSGQFDVGHWITNLSESVQFEVHCPLLDLPMVFETSLESIPSDVPYIKAEARLADRWRDRLCSATQSTNDKPMHVGLAWAGSLAHANDRKRSMTLSTLAPLAEIDNLHFISLQKGPGAVEASNPPGPMNLTDWTPELNDFADTAALIANLDLIITIDSAVAHLAGAMGKPVWLLLPFLPDWRWMMHREDSPWYPTMRLFRQPAPGDWETPVRKVGDALRELS
jgi:Flp pilus assembly protein TadD